MTFRASLTPFLVSVLFFSGCKKSVEVVFPINTPDPAEVAKIMDADRKALEGFEPKDSSQAVIDAYLQFNRLSVSDLGNAEPLENAAANLRLTINSCLEKDGQETMKKICLWLLARFEDALHNLLQSPAREDVVKVLVEGAPASAEILPLTTRLTELGGDFAKHAVQSGLLQVSPQGEIEFADGGKFFVRLAFKVRWTLILPEVTNPLGWLLSDFERKWYYFWVVERSRTAELERKIQGIEILEKMEAGYPADKARGIVYFQNHQYKQAAEQFKEALKNHPKDEQLKNFLNTAQSKMD